MDPLEQLVPEFADCQKAKMLTGNNTALVWIEPSKYSGRKVHSGIFRVHKRGTFNPGYPHWEYPAPTTDEICAKIPGGAVVNYAENCVESAAYDSHGEGMHEHWCNEDWCESKNPATAALRLLMRLESKS